MSSNALDKVKERLEEVMDDILESNEELNQLREIKNAIDWYRETEETKKEPGRIEALVINKIKEKVLDALPENFPNPSEFLQITFNKVVSSNHRVDIDFDLNFDLPKLKANLEFIMYVGNLPIKKSVLIVFQLNTMVNLRGVRIYSGDGKRWIKIKEVSVSVTLYLLSQMMIGLKRIEIGSRDFHIAGNLELLKTEKGIEIHGNDDPDTDSELRKDEF